MIHTKYSQTALLPAKPLFQGHTAKNKHSTFSKEQAEALALLALRQDQTAGSFLDHEKPRGSARIPGWVEAAGKKLSSTTVSIDFWPHQFYSAAQSTVNWGSRKLFTAVTQETQQTAIKKQRHADAQKLVAAVDRQLPLAEIYDIEEGINPEQTRKTLQEALQAFPELMTVVNNALTHPVIATLKWPLIAKPDLKETVKKILTWQQTRESLAIRPTAASENPTTPSKNSSNTHIATPQDEGGEIQPAPLPETNTTAPALPIGAQADVAVTQPKARELARELQASGALSARAGQSIAASLRKIEHFQRKNLTEADIQTQFQKNQYPPVKNPHEFMVLDPEETAINVTNRLPSTQKAERGNQRWWQTILPHPKKPVLENHPLPVKVTSKDPNAQLIIAALLKDHPLPPIRPNTTLALQLRDEKSFKKNVFRPIVDTFRITEEIEIKDPDKPGEFKKVQLKEACLWPFIEAILLKGEQGLGPNCKVKGTNQKCFDLLADADIYQFTSSDPELAKILNDRLHNKADQKLRDLKAKLAAIQLAGLQYAEQVDVLDTVGTFSKGFAAGIAGEQLASHIGGEAKPGKSAWKTPGTWIRLAFLSMVDTIDNWYGEHGVLEADLRGMGLSNSQQHVFGDNPPAKPVEMKHYLSARHATNLPGWLESLRRRLLLMGAGDADGKASQSVATTYRSVALGGLGGVAASVYAAKTFTEQKPRLHEQMLSTSIGTLGAFSIPINFGLTLPRVMSSYNEHLEAGRLLLPEHIKPDNQKAVEAHVREMAMQEMMSRTGLQASLKSYTVIPALGLVWPAQLVIPRHVLQSVLSPFMPVAENLTRMGMMLDRVARTFPKSLTDTEGMVLSAFIHDEKDMGRYQQQIRRAFNGLWPNLTAQGMNMFTYPLQMAMTHRKHIDFHDGPDYLAEQKRNA